MKRLTTLLCFHLSLLLANAVVGARVGFPLPYGLLDVTYANDLYVAVGEQGAIFSSTNGWEWVQRWSEPAINLQNVRYLNQQFVAVGGVNGTILTSSNGQDWAETRVGSPVELAALAYGNGVFVAGGNTFWSSTDGWTWSRHSASGVTNLFMGGLAYGNGTFVAVGADGRVLTSINGTNWVHRGRPVTAWLRAVEFIEGSFIAAGEAGTLLRSTNGISWTRQTSGSLRRLTGIARGVDRSVVVGEAGTVLVSPDQLSWTNRPAGSAVDFEGVAHGNGLFVAVGKQGDGGRILVSSNQLEWIDLSVLPASPTLFSQPLGQEPLAGSSATLSVLASGNPAPTYQWQRNESELPGATAPTFALHDVTPAESGSYRVVVSNFWGSVTSEVAQVTVRLQAPTVSASFETGGPFPPEGSLLRLCGLATGAPPPTLQWQWESQDLLNQTNACLSLDNITTNQSGAYRLVARNSSGSAISEVLQVSVRQQAPSVSIRFAAGGPVVPDGASVALCADATGAPMPTLQWQFNGVDIPRAVDTCLGLGAVAPHQAGQYSVVASNRLGSVTSAVVSLTVELLLPTVQVYFSSGGPTVLAGADVGLCANVGGSLSPSLQWQFNGQDLIDQTNRCLVLAGIAPSQAGLYAAVASNVVGVVTSAVAQVTVELKAPAFVVDPADLSLADGNTARLNGFAPAGPPAEYVLQFNGHSLGTPYTYLPYQGLPGGGFTLLEVTTADAGLYSIIASNALGMATSRVATLTVKPAGPLDRWTQRNPLPQSQPILALANGSGLFVGVGEHGTLLTSLDGTNWVKQSRRVALSLRGVAYGDGQFVAVGEAGTILTSIDGTNWVHRHSSPVMQLEAVSFGNDRFVAIGLLVSQALYSGIALHSTDGITWEEQSLPDPNLRGVAFGKGSFVAVGSSIFLSKDGQAWTRQLSGLSYALEAVAFGDDRFVAVGGAGSIMLSGDGTVWFPRPSGITQRLLGIAYGNGQYVAVGTHGILLSSPSGLSWTQGTSGTPDRLETILFDRGTFVAAGENGTTITSANGAAWAKQNQGTTRDLDGMTLAGDQLVIVGKAGTILTSTDGVHYREQASGTTNDLHGIGWGNGGLVAVGEPGVILTSRDAIHWTSQDSGTNQSLKRVYYGNRKWIAVGTQATILISDDGVAWQPSLLPPFNGAPARHDLNDVSYGNGLFVIAGDGPYGSNGSLFTSPDGVQWTDRSGVTSRNLRSVLFADDGFLVTGNDGLVLTSKNGLDWQSRFVVPAFDYVYNLRSALRAPILWGIVGNTGTILTSTNALDWTQRASRTSENLHGLEYFKGTLVAIGNRGNILQSAHFLPHLEVSAFHPGRSADILIHGVADHRYQLQASSDFIHWLNLLPAPATQDEKVYKDEEAPLHSSRFYRLIEP